MIKLARAGYAILPIWWLRDDGACACGNANCRSPGKHPIVPHGANDASNDPARVEEWLQRYPQANWGLAMGKNGLCTVDVDPRNGGDVAWDRVIEQWGEPPETWTQRTGNNGSHYVFRAPLEGAYPWPFGPGIDFKRGNSYILIEPSRTKNGYFWLDDSGPLGSVPLAQWINPPEAPKAIDTEPGTPGLDVKTAETLNKALQYISNYERDTWLKVGMALHFADPAPTGMGFALWDAWSQQPPGDTKYQAQDQAKTWRSFSRKRKEVLTPQSIYRWASQAGWVETLDAETQAAIDAMIQNMKQPLDIKAPPAPGNMPACPVTAIEVMAEWLGQGYRQASLAGALMACSLSASRRYISHDGVPANVYIGISASSINEVRYVLNGVERLFNEAGLRRLVRSGRFSSVGSLYKTLIKAPATGYLTSEWETLLKFAKRQPSGIIDMVLNLLSDLHGRTFLQIDSADEFGLTKLVSDDQPVIRYPALSMLALMSHEAIDLLAKTSEIGRGASEQMLLVHCDAADWRDTMLLPTPAPTALIDLIRKVRGLDPKADNELDTDLSRLFDACSELEPHLQRVSMIGDYAEWDAAIDQLSGSRSMRPLLQGAKVNLRRLCVALAAWNDADEPVITTAIRDWCGQWVIKALRHYLDTVDVMLNDGAIDLSQRVLAAILEAGPEGIHMKALRQMVRKFGRQPADERSKLMQQLLDDGDIFSDSQKRSVRYVHASFVANKGARGPKGARGVAPEQTQAGRGFQGKGPGGQQFL